LYVRFGSEADMRASAIGQKQTEVGVLPAASSYFILSGSRA